jgi:S-adenosyl-L-methionine hydrolase (adenosine-forming)
VTRPILFLSDFGLDDEYVGLCHAVIARVAPEAKVIDLHHGVPPHDVVTGARTLAQAVSYGPEDAVFLAVVDPGVGTRRRGVALEAGDALLVGPDNGILMEAALALGGVTAGVELEAGRVVPWPVSDTFHGRDVFAPAAARLAAGAELGEVGRGIDPGTLTLPALLAGPEAERGRVSTSVIGVDRFGNVRLGALPGHLETAELEAEELVLLVAGAPVTVRRVRTYGELEPAAVGLLVDSAGWLAVVRNGASAAEHLGLRPGDAVELQAAGVG